MFSGSKLEVRASIHGLCRQHPAPCWVAPALQLRGTRSARALTARGRGRLLGALRLVVFLHVSGDFRHGTTPNSWIVYKGKSYGKMDDLGVPPKIYGNPMYTSYEDEVSSSKNPSQQQISATGRWGIHCEFPGPCFGRFHCMSLGCTEQVLG